jgi:hypothetical protein
MRNWKYCSFVGTITCKQLVGHLEMERLLLGDHEMIAIFYLVGNGTICNFDQRFA